jgi:hypothetical protein
VGRHAQALSPSGSFFRGVMPWDLNLAEGVSLFDAVAQAIVLEATTFYLLGSGQVLAIPPGDDSPPLSG